VSAPAAIAASDAANSFVDQITESDQNGEKEKDKDKDSADTTTPPNYWLGPINVGPVTFGKPIDDPVTSGSDAAGVGPIGTVDTGPSQ
jgi:hypothetical protein